jgi:hypothetical protein
MAVGHTKVSEPVREILNELVRRQGDAKITAEEAKNLYGGNFPTTVNRLGTVELLQVALLEAYTMLAHGKRKRWWRRK